jgi:hypothetical protein
LSVLQKNAVPIKHGVSEKRKVLEKDTKFSGLVYNYSTKPTGLKGFFPLALLTAKKIFFTFIIFYKFIS